MVIDRGGGVGDVAESSKLVVDVEVRRQDATRAARMKVDVKRHRLGIAHVLSTLIYTS